MGSEANPQTAIGDVNAIETSAQGIIEARFGEATAVAEAAAAAAGGFLSALSGISMPPFVGFNPVFTFPPVPTINTDIPEPNMQAYYGMGTGMILKEMPYTAIHLGNAPAFDITPIVPVIPEFPDLIFPEFTEERPIVRDVTLPEEPTFEMPELPIMNVVSLPVPISLDLPTFDAIVPVDNIAIPVNVIDPGIFDYDSPILRMLKDKVLQWITTSGTGLNPAIEQAIYDRENERAVLALEQAEQDYADEWSKRGFILPDGVFAANIINLIIDHKNKRLDTSRDIAINQAKLAQDNTHFYIEKALALETQLMNWTNLLGQRTFEASKAAMEAAISITQVEISRYNIRLQAYQVQASVYESRIKSELAKVEIFKAEIEAANLTAEQNRIAAEIYKIRTDAIQALISLYLARQKAAMASLEVDKEKIECFKSLAQVYVEQINGITAKYNAYGTRMKGEEIKVSIFSEEVNAWKSRIEAFKVEADVEIENARTVVAINEAYIKRYAVDVEHDKAEMIYSAESAKAASEAYQAHVLAHKARAEAETAKAQVLLKGAEMQIEASIRVAEGVRNAQEANMRGYLAAESTRIEAAKGGAAVAAQMAAGAFAGVNVSAQIGAHAQASQSYQGQESLSEVHHYEHQTSE